MKRALGLIFLTAACIVGFLSIRGTMPFMPIFGTSMEPTLHSGGLLMIEPIDLQDVKVGNIIVYSVPKMVREYYNYPPIVSHRVIAITTQPSLGFRTKGDNTGEDPFTVRPLDLRGTVGKQIPYLGLPLLFFQSQQGLIFVIVGLVLLAIFLYGSALGRSGNMVHRSLFSPVINEEKRSNRLLTRKIESTEKKMDATEQALVKFSAAIAEYAQHLSSHTSAIQGLAEASHELKKSAAEQNKVISYLAKSLEPPRLNIEEPTSGAERAAREAVKPTLEAVRPLAGTEKPEPEAVKRVHEAVKLIRETVKRVHETEKPVPEAVKPAHETAKVVPELEKLAIERVKAAHELQKLMLEKVKPAPETVKPESEAAEKEFPPGCARNRQPLIKC